MTKPEQDDRLDPRPADTQAEEKPAAVQPGDRVAEEYRKYKEAERQERQRLERYERTRSTDTEHPARDGG